MKTLCATCSSEIAWHGTVQKIADDKYMVLDILVYPQKVTAMTVESDEAHYATWLNELPDDVFNSIRLQGHSHVNMGVTPSGTDDDFYETLDEHVKDFYIYVIMNKRNEIYTEIHDVANNLVYETTDINVTYLTSGFDYNAWYAEAFKVITTNKSTLVSSTFTSFGTPVTSASKIAALTAQEEAEDAYWHGRINGGRY